MPEQVDFWDTNKMANKIGGDERAVTRPRERVMGLHGFAASIILLLIVPPAPLIAADDAVAEARRLLYTNRQCAIALLEEEVQRSPGDAAAWTELVHALDVDGADAFADRASRTALDLHPDHAPLLLARARLLPTSPALDVLARLAKVPGHEQEAADLSERLALDIRIPDPRYPRDPHIPWASRLIAADRHERALEVVDKGLRLNAMPEEREQLQAIRAIALALSRRYDECLDAQRGAKGVQYQIDGRWTGAADVLLSKDEPELAIRSFAGRKPPASAPKRRAMDGSDHANARERHVLAMALVRTGKPAEAAALLGDRERQDQVLLVRVYVLAGDVEKARAVGAKLVAPLPSGATQDRKFGSLIENLHGEMSVESDYRAAAAWLAEQFPEKRWGIVHVIGGPDDRPRRPLGFSQGMLPSSQRIPQLKAALAAAADDPAEAEDLRWQLANALEQAGQFQAAADCAAPLAKGMIRRYSEPFSYHAMKWAVLRRRATTEAYYKADPRTLASSRFLLAAPNARAYNSGGVPNRPWPDDDEVVEKLNAMGAGVLAPVIDALAPNTISADDRSPFVRAIAALGDEGDVPVLIYVMAQMMRDTKRSGAPLDARAVAGRSPTLAALRDALPALTKVRPPLGADEIAFWTTWWAANAAKIVDARNPAR